MFISFMLLKFLFILITFLYCFCSCFLYLFSFIVFFVEDGFSLLFYFMVSYFYFTSWFLTFILLFVILKISCIAFSFCFCCFIIFLPFIWVILLFLLKNLFGSNNKINWYILITSILVILFFNVKVMIPYSPRSIFL